MCLLFRKRRPLTNSECYNSDENNQSQSSPFYLENMAHLFVIISFYTRGRARSIICITSQTSWLHVCSRQFIRLRSYRKSRGFPVTRRNPLGNSRYCKTLFSVSDVKFPRHCGKHAFPDPNLKEQFTSKSVFTTDMDNKSELPMAYLEIKNKIKIFFIVLIGNILYDGPAVYMIQCNFMLKLVTISVSYVYIMHSPVFCCIYIISRCNM